MDASIYRCLPRIITTAGWSILCLLMTGCAHIDKGHDRVSDHLLRLTKELDSILGEPLEDEAYRKTRVTLTGGICGKEGEGFSVKGHSKAKIPLPSIRDRIGILIGGESNPEREEDPGADLLQEDTREYESFLRLFNKQKSPLNWDFDIGLRWSGDFRYFFRLSGLNEGWLGLSLYRIAPRLYWRSDDGFGSQLRYEMDQQVASYCMLREFLEIKYTEQTRGADVYGGVYLRTNPRETLALSLEMVHLLATHPWEYQYVEFLYRLRSIFVWRWLEIELVPRIRLKRKDGDWNLVPYLEMYLHVTFDARHLKYLD